MTRAYHRVVAGYSGTPLAKKLGIKEGAKVVLLGAPAGFAGTLEPLPEGAKVTTALPRAGTFDRAVVFAKTEKELRIGFEKAQSRMAPAAGVWIAWPKKASKVETELSDDVVRTFGLAVGLVDNKVCAIDDVWSALCFVVRTIDRKA